MTMNDAPEVEYGTMLQRLRPLEPFAPMTIQTTSLEFVSLSSLSSFFTRLLNSIQINSFIVWTNL
jgi:hypothetical protein